jgi:hypothetical protein
MFRPKISEPLVEELHRLAIRENRTLTSMVEVTLKTGLRAMKNLPPPPWAPNKLAKSE